MTDNTLLWIGAGVAAWWLLSQQNQNPVNGAITAVNPGDMGAGGAGSPVTAWGMTAGQGITPSATTQGAIDVPTGNNTKNGNPPIGGGPNAPPTTIIVPSIVMSGPGGSSMPGMVNPGVRTPSYPVATRGYTGVANMPMSTQQPVAALANVATFDHPNRVASTTYQGPTPRIVPSYKSSSQVY